MASILPPGKTLFTVPVEACDNHPGGAVTVTEPAPQVYLLAIASPPDNRQTTALCRAVLRALDLVEFSGLPPGCVVTTSAISKFYSNGLDLDHARRTGDPFWHDALWPLYRRFLTYPMPTVAWMNGHAFAGGLMLAMHHDYRVMSADRGFCCLNELEFGAPLKPQMSAIFRVKVPSPHVYREMVLEARRYGGRDALAAGLVDAVTTTTSGAGAEGGAWPDVLALVEARKLTGKGKTGVYGLLKMEMYRECLDLLENGPREDRKDEGWFKAEDERCERGRREVEAWLGKSKL